MNLLFCAENFLLSAGNYINCWIVTLQWKNRKRDDMGCGPGVVGSLSNKGFLFSGERSSSWCIIQSRSRGQIKTMLSISSFGGIISKICWEWLLSVSLSLETSTLNKIFTLQNKIFTLQNRREFGNCNLDWAEQFKGITQKYFDKAIISQIQPA